MGVYVDHYQILGLPSGVAGTKISQTDIAKAYKKKALELHPDKRHGDPNAVIDFQNLQASYEILKNEKARKDFDDNFVVRVNKKDMKRKRQPTAGFEEEEEEEEEEVDQRGGRTKMSDFDRRKRAAAFRRRVYEVNERKCAAEFEERNSEAVSEDRKRRAAYAYGSNPKERILKRMQNMYAKKKYVF